MMHAKQVGQSQWGFTLIELMIVVAVIAILSAIAIPAYDGYVRRSYRAQAKADLTEIAQLAERYHTVNNSYVGFAVPAALGQTPRSGGTARYLLQLNGVPTQRAYSLQAVPQGTQGRDACGTLSLNQAGAKGVSGSTVADCW